LAHGFFYPSFPQPQLFAPVLFTIDTVEFSAGTRFRIFAHNQLINFPDRPGCATVEVVLLPAISYEGSDTTMNAPPVGVERRIGQRFPFNVPVALRDVSTATEGLGFTQDLSSRGAFLFTDMALNEGADIELTLKMPSEITLGESMRVRCRGRVLRIVKPVDNGWKPVAEIALPEAREIKPVEAGSAEIRSAETKIGVAVCLSGYEYLPDIPEGSADFRRISALHSSDDSERPSIPGNPPAAAH